MGIWAPRIDYGTDPREGPVFAAAQDDILRGQRNPIIAREGLPLMALAMVLFVLVLRFTEMWLAVLPLGRALHCGL